MKIATILFVLLALSACIFAYFGIKNEISKNIQLESNLQNKDYSSIYSFYIANQPIVQNRASIGHGPLSFIAVIDVQDPKTKLFWDETIKPLYEKYVLSGNATLYVKQIIQKEEYETQTGRFKYAQVACSNSFEEIDAIVHGAEPASANCSAIYEDMFQTETFRIFSPSISIGINGKQNVVLYGIPNPTTLQKRIREKEVQLGI